ncbi:hypothetical protein DYL59_25025 [Pseudomonas kairouanensis]|uniref:EAL domain-containing protein n=1 Tax=Pseudomonas kairouanensis TaxID=2293832 RepID=A0A4Z0AFV9_9PSED|nr:hypothetical protein [Pseudomonas kairouanensis]TFY85642.1 hypothetical protein DYL59_25025 [Pseudomonas kairouanensis]
MNSETVSVAPTPDIAFVRQAIVTRSHALWGSEVRVVGAPVDSAYSEALAHIRPRNKTFKTASMAVSHKFLRLPQSTLMNDAALNDIIRVSQALEKQQQTLTLSLDNALDTLPGPVERRAMVRQLYKLKDQSGIKLAYNNYRLDTKPADLLIGLALYDFIKMPFPDSALRLSLNTRSGLFDCLYDRMLELINTTRVCFIADHVEFSDSAMLAKNLPFEYFQGGYYSPADRL